MNKVGIFLSKAKWNRLQARLARAEVVMSEHDLEAGQRLRFKALDEWIDSEPMLRRLRPPKCPQIKLPKSPERTS
jgi:hypothetical protein